MPIKNIIAGGVGFSPGSVKYIPTRGFTAGDVVIVLAGSLVCGGLSVMPKVLGLNSLGPAVTGLVLVAPQVLGETDVSECP